MSLAFWGTVRGQKSAATKLQNMHATPFSVYIYIYTYITVKDPEPLGFMYEPRKLLQSFLRRFNAREVASGGSGRQI